jgi:hypothetical protein
MTERIGRAGLPLRSEPGNMDRKRLMIMIKRKGKD